MVNQQEKNRKINFFLAFYVPILERHDFGFTESQKMIKLHGSNVKVSFFAFLCVLGQVQRWVLERLRSHR